MLLHLLGVSCGNAVIGSATLATVRWKEMVASAGSAGNSCSLLASDTTQMQYRHRSSRQHFQCDTDVDSPQVACKNFHDDSHDDDDILVGMRWAQESYQYCQEMQTARFHVSSKRDHP